MFRVTVLLTALLLTGTAVGQIDVPATVEPHAPIVAKIAFGGLPEGARTRGSISVSDAMWLPAGGADNCYHIWAAPGSHSVVAEGMWVLTRDVTVDGQTLPVLLDFGSYRYTATFTVGKSPGPDPPVPPPGERWILVVEETGQRTAAQANLWIALRKELPNQRLLIVDKDSPPPSLARLLESVSSADSLPILLVVRAGVVLRKLPMPTTVQAVKEELAR